jgi:hypothetical protein
MNQSTRSTLQKTVKQMTPSEKLESLDLILRSLRADMPPGAASAQRAAQEKVFRRLAKLPLHNASDGFSNRDHDSVLYGGLV